MSETAKGYTGLTLEIDGHVAIVTLSHAPANAWTRDSLVALRHLVHDLDANRDIYALVITGAGEKFFSAGADLKQFADGDKAVAREAARRFGEAFGYIRKLTVAGADESLKVLFHFGAHVQHTRTVG